MTGEVRTYEDGVAIVTGAASGIGKAISEELAARGCRVILADVDGDEAEEAAAEIRERGGRASAKYVDVTSFEDVSELVTDTLSETGRIDYMFNNAGIGVFGDVENHTIDAWERIIAVNLGGVVNGVHAAYPEMIRQGFGHIVNTASLAGLITSATAYSTTKHAVVGLSKGLRVEAQSHGIRVSVICPGVIRTPILRGGKHGVFTGSIPEDKQRELASQLLEQFRPMDVTRFAHKLLNQIARNRAIIVIPAWVKALWWIERLSPVLGGLLARSIYARYRQRVSALEANAD